MTVEQTSEGRPHKPFSELSSFAKRICVQEGIEALGQIEQGHLPSLVQAIAAKVEEEQMLKNIAFFCANLPSSIS